MKLDKKLIQKLVEQNSKKSSKNFRKRSNPKAYKGNPNKYKADMKLYAKSGYKASSNESAVGVTLYRDNALEAAEYGMYNKESSKADIEIMALYAALDYIKDNVDLKDSAVVFTTSKHAIKVITENSKKWKRFNWKNKNGSNMADIDLIKMTYELYESMKGTVPIFLVDPDKNFEGVEVSKKVSDLAISRKQNKLKSSSRK